jgi:hypothetical protein
MASASKRRRLIARARELYALGRTQQEVARLLQVNRRTIRDWKEFDARRGIDWDEESGLPGGHGQMLRALRRRLACLVVQDGSADPEDPEAAQAHEKRILTMVKVISTYRKSATELSAQLQVMQEFAAFCAERLPERDLRAVREAVGEFIASLRKENQ